ncbi:MAG TPA: DUF881 domain-containing protein [Propionibacteriaceae bacterium]
MPDEIDVAARHATDSPDATGEQGDKPASRSLRDLVKALMRPSASQILLAAVLLVFGIGVGTQITTTTADDPYATARRADLIQLLDTANTETSRLENEIEQLKTTRDKLQSGVDSAKVAQAEAQNRLDNLAILNGTVGATGPGVRVVIYDPAQKVTASTLLDTIEEFRDAGAEVIEINDSIRVVASTWFSSANGSLVADNVAISLPIVIDVIGDGHALEEAARFRGGLVSQVQQLGGTVTITQQTNVTITAVRQLPQNHYARPA